ARSWRFATSASGAPDLQPQLKLSAVEDKPAARALGERAFAMSSATTIRRFLRDRPGHYCEECLAASLRVPLPDVRRAVRDMNGGIIIRYRLCSECALEKETVAIAP